MTIAVRNARVVAGREPIRAELSHDVAEECLELHVVVARYAGIRRLAARVRVHEAVHHIAAEDLGVVERVERDAEHRRRPTCVLPRLIRPAAARRVGVVAGGHKTHPHADDILAALGKERRGDRRVDTAAHGYEYAAHAVTAASLRMRETTPGNTARNASTSVSVVARPTVTRSEPFAISRSRPSARMTCDGSVSPEVHADPLDTAKP